MASILPIFERLARFSGGARVIAGVGLSAFFGLFLARMIWLVVSPDGAVSQPQPLQSYQVGMSGSGVVLSVDRSLLVSMDPFGVDAAPDIVEDAPETRLNLVLKGLRATGDETGSAIIQTPDGRSASFQPGDEVLEGVRLRSVLADRVLLDKNGDVEALTMGGDGALSVLTRPGDAARPRNAATPDTAIASEPDTFRASRALLASVQIDPVNRGTQFVGYRLSANGDRAALSAAGIQSGDILIGFDGDPITDVDPGDLIDRFSNASRFLLTIDRDGEVLDLNIELVGGP